MLNYVQKNKIMSVLSEIGKDSRSRFISKVISYYFSQWKEKKRAEREMKKQNQGGEN